MRMFRTFAISLLAVLGAWQLGGCAASPESRATGQVVDDSSITARVKTALAKDASLATARDVNVTTYRGVVQLSGFVESDQMKQRAESVARQIDGVRSVENDLRVTPRG